MDVRIKFRKPKSFEKETLRSNKSIILLFFTDYDRTLPNVVELKDRIVFLNNDIIFSSFYLLSGLEERFIRLDSKDRHNIQDSFLYQNDPLHTPIINQHAILLRNLFSTTNSFLPVWPQAKKYAVALSHDVDYPEIIPYIEIVRYGIARKSKSKMSKMYDILSGKESFFKFNEWLTLESKYGMRSAFYFCGFLGSLTRYLLIAQDPFYDVTKKNL
jgi:hypothetical protein